MELIEKAKKFLKNKQLVEARELLKNAISLDQKPVLAHYYLGEVDALENKLNAAIKDYKTGLIYDSEHYKSLKSLFGAYNKTESYDDAYEVGKKLALTFPSTAEELEQLIHLTVRTKNFQDMTIFHELAKSVDPNDKILLNYIGSGLFVTGKYYLFHGMHNEALECFKKIVKTCPDFPKFVKGIIYTLIDNKILNEAEIFMDHIKKSEKDFKVCEFLIKREKLKDTEKKIEIGMKLLSETKDDYVLLAVLDDMEKSGRSDNEINQLKISFSRKAS
jgi:tetratricopeptide (TPR) repeat protein